MATATSAVTFDNLLCFPAMRRQATGIGIDLVSNVVLSIGEYPLAFTLRYKGVLVAHASASSLARVVGVEASHVRLEFVGERLGSWDLTLTTVAESDLLEFICEELLHRCGISAGIPRVVQNAKCVGLSGVDGRVLRRGDLQRKSKWFEAVLISGKLFLFAQDAARTSLPDTPPRHVLSLVGSVVEHVPRSYSIVLTNVTGPRPDKKISLCAPTRVETQQWADALRGAAMTETCYRSQLEPSGIPWGKAAGWMRSDSAATGPVQQDEGMTAPRTGSLELTPRRLSSLAAEDAPPRLPNTLVRESSGATATVAADVSLLSQPNASGAESVGAEPPSRVLEELPFQQSGPIASVATEARQKDDDAAPPTLSEPPPSPASLLQASDANAVEQRRAVARRAIEQQTAWVPRSTHEQVELFLSLFPDVARREVYKLRTEFDTFDAVGSGHLDVLSSMRLLEARKETRTFVELREMVEGAHVQSSLRHMSFLEWACTVFDKNWLDLCLQEASRGGGSAEGEEAARERAALYQARRRAEEEEDRAEAEKRARELASSREAIRLRGALFDRA